MKPADSSASVAPLSIETKLPFSIEGEACHQLDTCLQREWLLTNGTGGYASSSMLLCPTRRYHGLLVMAPPGTEQRHNFLARYDETVHGEGKSFPLSIARYRGLWSPHGHRSLDRFELVPFPSWQFQIGRARILREIVLIRDQRTVVCRYRLSGFDRPLELRLRPLLPFRVADALTFENMDLDPSVHRERDGFWCRPYFTLPAIRFRVSAMKHIEVDPVWYRKLEYQHDLARGYDGHEDQFSPAVLTVPLLPHQDVFIAASIEETCERPEGLFHAEQERQEAPKDRTVVAFLEREAEEFLYRDTHGRPGVIAGYPWFGEWGRDTFISLPGLTLARGQLDRCAEVLSGALAYLRRGLLPNIYGHDRDSSHYGSVDASLWFARAVLLYEQEGGDTERILEEYAPALTEIAECYGQGTDLGIRCREDGLVGAGDTETNATWMDARTARGPVTPRDGFVVEVNALWYSLLRHLERLALRAGNRDLAKQWMDRRRKVGRAFLTSFWLPKERMLADRISWTGEVDHRVRPNMVIAAALEYSPLSRGKRTDIVQRAEVELLTPRGLRTLAPDHPDYVGRYEGGPLQRDAAYHQGTVWPWLLGFLGEAMLRAYNWRKPRRERVLSWIDGFASTLVEHGLHHVSEVFDGDPPQRPGGTIAQAWSTAELLRLHRLVTRGRRE
ncbi:MAG: amylo-alpha-1,6-glucosidase [Planctomycetota bacterium]